MTTKSDVLEAFSDIKQSVIEEYPNDEKMMLNAWYSFLDKLCRDDVISSYQYHTWDRP